MDVWGLYEARLGAAGITEAEQRRGEALNRLQARLRREMAASISYKSVTIEGKESHAVITDTEEFNVKNIIAVPGERLPHGGIVKWADTVWLITEVDPNRDVYEKGSIQRCNYILKWIDDAGSIIQRWCIVEDGTKYLIGEKAESIISIGDARIAVTIGKDKDTNKLRRGQRFLIDDMDSDDVLAYQITKPNKLYSVFDGEGVFRFILNEVNSTDAVNKELRIADYYNWRPEKERLPSDIQVDKPLEEIVEDAKEDAAKEPEKVEEEQRWI